MIFLEKRYLNDFKPKGSQNKPLCENFSNFYLKLQQPKGLQLTHFFQKYLAL